MNFSPTPFFSFASLKSDAAQALVGPPMSVSQLTQEFQVRLGNGDYSELGALLAVLQGVARVHQTNHWRSKGDVFFSDHKLFERVYEQIPEQIDSLAERCVGMAGEELVDGIEQSKMTADFVEWLCNVYAPVSEGRGLAHQSLAAEECLQGCIEGAIGDMKSAGILTQGIANLLSQLADDHESSIYLLTRAAISP